MAYFVNLFSPETYQAFSSSARTISGFLPRHIAAASQVQPGDRLVCYMTKLSRWVGVLEVVSPCFTDDTPVFLEIDDPYTVRFRVKPLAWLAPEHALPINDDICWHHLSFTKDLPPKSMVWTGKVRRSLIRLDDADGEYLEHTMLRQAETPTAYALSDTDRRSLRSSVVNTMDGQVVVSIPEDDESDAAPTGETAREYNESTKIQALLAKIGEQLNLRVWLPRNDRQRVLDLWRPEKEASVLTRLPLNYDDVTLGTIENIDVLWIRQRAIIRAFEVEHTTSIYSGILRMADLMALQPNLSIKAHIVAPAERRKKVFSEITRPVFSLLGKNRLSQVCTYLSYDAVTELSQDENLAYMRDSIVEKYEEYAEEAER